MIIVDRRFLACQGLKLHPHWHNVQRMQLLGKLAQVDGVFLCGDERRRPGCLPQLEQQLNVGRGVRMMVAKRMRTHHAKTGLAKFGEKVRRSGDAAECEAQFLGLRRDDSAEHPPPVLVPRPGHLCCARVMHKGQCRRPCQRRQRLAQSPGRKQRVLL